MRDRETVWLVSRSIARHVVGEPMPRPAFAFTTSVDVARRVLEDAEGGGPERRMIQDALRRSRDERAATHGAVGLTWREEWYVGEANPARAVMEQRQPRKLDW